MIQRNSILIGATCALFLLSSAGCTRDTSHLEPVPPNTDPLVFSDGFGEGVDFQAFLGSDLTALSFDTNEHYQGTTSLKVTVPGPGNYAGGAFPAGSIRDLSGYNALTFWAKASQSATLDIAGLGNDNTGTSKYEASWSGIPLTTTWTKYAVPIPLPARLSQERGLFFFAEGPEGGAGYNLWFDEIKFENVPGISNPRPVMETRTVGSFVGANIRVTGTQTTFSVDGTDRTVAHLPGYFTFASSADSVAVIENGEVKVVGGGTATITGKLGAVDVLGELVVNVVAAPSEAAPTPLHPVADVVSLFSNSYPNAVVDRWSADWDRADVTDFSIAGNDVKTYTNLIFAGIEFIAAPIDATQMTHFHLDLWVPGGSVFRIKLVDFGADGAFAGGDDVEHELTFNASSTPPLSAESWIGFDIPLSDFTRLTTRGHLAQLVISGNTGTAYVDNIYFHK